MRSLWRMHSHLAKGRSPIKQRQINSTKNISPILSTKLEVSYYASSNFELRGGFRSRSKRKTFQSCLSVQKISNETILRTIISICCVLTGVYKLKSTVKTIICSALIIPHRNCRDEESRMLTKEVPLSAFRTPSNVSLATQICRSSYISLTCFGILYKDDVKEVGLPEFSLMNFSGFRILKRILSVSR